MDINLKGFKANCGHTQMGDLAIHRGRRMTESETRMAVNYGIEQGYELASQIPDEVLDAICDPRNSDYAKYDDTPRFLTLEALSDILRDIAGYRGYLEMTNAKNERKMKYSCPRIVQGHLAIEELTMAQFLLIREFIRICKRDGKWPNPDFGTPVNPRIEALLDEISQITTEDQKSQTNDETQNPNKRRCAKPRAMDRRPAHRQRRKLRLIRANVPQPAPRHTEPSARPPHANRIRNPEHKRIMLQSDTPYIVVPMEVMDKLNHQLFIFRANCPEHLKGSLDFADHNRLHIAAMLAAGMLANEVRCYPVDRALELADQLIAACEKGGQDA